MSTASDPTPAPARPLRVAVVQARPAPLDLAAGLALVERWTAEAAEAGAKVVAFGETFLGGYPMFLDHARNVASWGHGPTKAVFEQMRASALVVDSADGRRLGEIAQRHGVTLVLGATERTAGGPGYGTLYNALLIFDRDGRLALHHRKLVPTYTERLVWGPGDAHGLDAVQMPEGRISGLVCWEHWMPAARQVLHDAGEDVHVAQWPSVGEDHQLASRHYAFEGRCFVLAAGTIARGADMPPGLEHGFQPDDLVLNGGSAIIGPDGRYVVEPRFDEEALLVADLDLAHADRERMTLDVAGHYARPDVFSLRVDRRRRGTTTTTSSSSSD